MARFGRGLEIEERHITTSGVIEVSQDDLLDRIQYIKSTYGTYDRYSYESDRLDIKSRLRIPSPDKYIFDTLLTPIMRSVFNESSQYLRSPHRNDPYLNQLNDLRGRVLRKIGYMKHKLGRAAFPVGFASFQANRRANRINNMQQQPAMQYPMHYLVPVPVPMQDIVPVQAVVMPVQAVVMPVQAAAVPKKNKLVTTAIDFNGPPNHQCSDECAICMDLHLTVDLCRLSCGHYFGHNCFSIWGKDHNNTCPYCRAECTEITVYIMDVS